MTGPRSSHELAVKETLNVNDRDEMYRLEGPVAIFQAGDIFIRRKKETSNNNHFVTASRPPPQVEAHCHPLQRSGRHPVAMSRRSSCLVRGIGKKTTSSTPSKVVPFTAVSTDQTGTANTFSKFQPPVQSTPSRKVIGEQPGPKGASLERRRLQPSHFRCFLREGEKKLKGNF